MPRDTPAPVSFGLIGATGIAVRALLDPATRTEGRVTVAAVAAGTPERAREFARTHGIPAAHLCYRDLLHDPGITAVYISLHNSAHAQWAAEAAAAGKHVLVEKPLCLASRELHGIRRAAETTGVHVAEALMTQGHPWQAHVAALIREPGDLGELLAVRTRVTFGGPTGYRRHPELGGGILLDAAPYWLQAVQATVGLDVRDIRDLRVDAKSTGTRGADEACEATLTLDSGVRAELSCFFGERPAADHEFVFARGHARLRGFLRPAAAALPLNLAVTTDSRRRVEAFPAVHYYDAQLARTAGEMAARRGMGDRAWAEPTARTAVLEALQRAAYEP